MLRDLKETDINAICEINQEALGYSFSPGETASQLARLSQDSHHFLLGYEDVNSHVLLGYVHAEVYESLYSKAGFNILALAVSPEAQGQGIGKKLITRVGRRSKKTWLWVYPLKLCRSSSGCSCIL